MKAVAISSPGKFGRSLRSGTSATVERERKFIPIASTIALFAVMYLFGWLAYPAMRDWQAFFNLFDAAPFLIVLVVGEGLVIVSGGIDLSVSGILAFTSVVAASLIYMGWDPWLVFPLVLLIGMCFGLVMGLFITYLKVQPFIATLAGMWLARGLSYVISDAEVRIHNSTYSTLGQTKIMIPGLSNVSNPDPYLRTGDYVTYLVVVALLIFVFGLFLAHFTRFGRTVYAMGGGNGANEASARLMGLPVNRTKVLVYTFSGFCSALAGILYSIYVMSGRGNHGTGYELTTIAACVIGGIALTGGEGYLVGALVGVLVTSLIQSLLLYNGELSSYWTYIFIGGLMLIFIGIQALVSRWNEQAIGRARYSGHAARARVRPVWYKRRGVRRAAVGALVVVLAFGAVQVIFPAVFPKQTTASCTLKDMRANAAEALVTDGAVIVYERNGGTSCIDELYAIYPDGRVVSDYGAGNVVKSQIESGKVDTLLKQINDLGFFTDDFFDSHHTPCGACFQYWTSVTFEGKTKHVAAVDGGTDAPAKYWNMTGYLAAILYRSHP